MRKFSGYIFAILMFLLLANTVSATTPKIDSPEILSAAAAGHSVSLSWTASTSTVVGYIPFRGLTSGSEVSLIATPSVGTTFTDTTVSASTTYFYYVVAVDAAGNQSVPSNEVSVTVPSDPATVTSVTVTCAPTSIASGAKATCTATVAGTSNPSQSVTWSANAPLGVFTGAKAGTFTITATSVLNPTISGSATVVVQLPAPPTGLGITSVAVNQNGHRTTITASWKDTNKVNTTSYKIFAGSVVLDSGSVKSPSGIYSVSVQTRQRPTLIVVTDSLGATARRSL